MSKWIKRSKSIPDPKEHHIILVYCETCSYVHAVHHDYGDWCHVECCHEGGHLSPGMDVDFNYWMPEPKKPNV